MSTALVVWSPEISQHGQPLIPSDMKEGGRFDGHLIKCFYAPVYLLSTIATDLYYAEPELKKQTTKSDLHCALFLSISQDVLKLHWLYGMVLPIPMRLRKCLPALFDILTPATTDGRSDLLHFMDGRKEGSNVKGWSNIPLLLCIISHLVSTATLFVDSVNPMRSEEMENLDDFRMRFLGLNRKFVPLDELVQQMLFKVNEGMKNWGLARTIRESTDGITKAIVYKWLKEECFRDNPDLVVDYEKEEEKDDHEDNKKGSKEDEEDTDEEDKDEGSKVGDEDIEEDELDDDEDMVEDEEKEDEEVDKDNEQKAKRKKAQKMAKSSKARRKGEKKDEGKEEKKRKKEKAKVGEHESDEKQEPKKKKVATVSIKVRNVHPMLPPPHIDVTDTPWYWQLCECEKEHNWPFEISKVEVLLHLKRNVAKLVYTWIAKEYAVVQKITSGPELMAVLARPALCKRPEQSIWCRLLKDLEARCKVMVMGVVKCPDFDVVPSMEVNAGTSFCRYFEAVLNESYPAEATNKEGINEENNSDEESGSEVESGEAMVLTNCCWLPQDVGDMDSLTWETVERKTHVLKCQILFDRMCYCYFGDFSDFMLTRAVLNLWDSSSLCKSRGMKLDWELDFNLLVWNVKKIDLTANKAAKAGAYAETRTKSLAQYCLTEIQDMWKAMLPDLAEEKQPTIGDGTKKKGKKESPRPLCRELNVTNESKMDDTVGLYFTAEGFMRRDLRWSIFFGHPNHGLIRFERFVTNDVRYFIPIVTLSDEEQGKMMGVLSDAASPVPDS